jgi:hypothetical protein
MASVYVDMNFGNNRPKIGTHISNLVYAIKRGMFYPTHQGIAFDDSGKLIDGQHRLMAILLSGIGQWMLVTRGMPHGSVVAVDVGSRRSDDAQIRILFDEEVSKRDVAIARSMWLGFEETTGQRLTPEQLHAFLVHHADAIIFSQQYSGGVETLSSGAIRSVVAKAYYHIDRDRLSEFLRVISSGIAQGDHDTAAIKFRDRYLRDKFLKSSSTKARGETVRVTTSALVRFFKGDVVKEIRPANSDPYPIPAAPPGIPHSAAEDKDEFRSIRRQVGEEIREIRGRNIDVPSETQEEIGNPLRRYVQTGKLK